MLLHESAQPVCILWLHMLLVLPLLGVVTAVVAVFLLLLLQHCC
jgi:hypothetical protein